MAPCDQSFAAREGVWSNGRQQAHLTFLAMCDVRRAALATSASLALHCSRCAYDVRQAALTSSEKHV